MSSTSMSADHSFDISQLLPTSKFLCGFTTCSYIKPLSNLQLVPFSDSELGVHKVSSSTTHNIVHPPRYQNNEQNAPALAWEAIYPTGSINPSGSIPGGFGFYLSGPPGFAQRLESAKEVIFSYRMMLHDEWEWVKGGKLPGVCTSPFRAYGGVGDLAYGCTGGRQEKRCQCFNLRPMWRSNSIGELYAYLPLTQSNEKKLSSVPPLSIVNPDYGISVGRGAFTFSNAVSRWISIAFRVKLNDVGTNNGEIELWVDGKSVMSTSGLEIRASEEGKVRGMHFQTFFGGHGKDWASPKNQRAWFSDVTSVIIQ